MLDVTDLVLNSGGDGGLGGVGGALALLVGETGRHVCEVVVVGWLFGLVGCSWL
jgi:hypothetical protein